MPDGGEGTHLKYTEVIMCRHVFLGHHSVSCRKPFRTSACKPLPDTGETMMLAGALENFYGNYEVRAKKVKTKGREEMFSFGFPTKSEDSKREKSK